MSKVTYRETVAVTLAACCKPVLFRSAMKLG
jgi:hypothetical protein